MYESKDEQFASVVPFLRDGLERGEQCLYLANDTATEEVASALRSRGVEVDAAVASGQLSIQPAADLYLTDGSFDPERTITRIERRAGEAIDAGYDRLRIAAETTWAVEHDVDLDRVESYERRVDEIFTTNSLTALCQYRRSEFPSEFLANSLDAHPRVVHDAETKVNHQYEPPGAVGEDGSQPDAIDRKLRSISERHRLSDSLDRRDRSLSHLSQLTDQLRDANHDDVGQIAGEIMAEVVEPSFVSFRRFDSSEGELRTQFVQNGVRGVDVGDRIEEIDDRTWDAFVEGDARPFAVDAETPLSGYLLPVGRHGVFLVGSPETVPIAKADRHFLESVCGQAEAVLDQRSSESDLEEKNARLEEQTAYLQRVDQINTIVREISQSLVDAATEEEIERDICTLLVQESCISFAWFASYEPSTETLHAKQMAGDDRGYLDALSTEDDWARTEPTGRAAQSRTIDVAQHVYDDPPLTHWRKQALKREFQSAISLPICFDDSMYGVLSLYADTPEIFGNETVSILEELGDLVAHGINSIKRKRALVTRSVTELKVRVTETEMDLVGFVDDYDCRVEIDEIASTSQGGTRLFLTIHGATTSQIRTFATESPSIDEIEFLSEGNGVHSFELVVTDRCITVDLLNHNAVPQSMTVEDGVAQLILQLPREQNVREFMEMVKTKYPDAEFVGRVEREQSLQKLSSVETRLEEELTERQLEMLTLAYHSGYFERPRERTAKELADSLDVSPPTVTRHLREAERRVFSFVLDAE